MDKKSKIFIAGHNGMVGSAILKMALKLGYQNIITSPKSKLDLTDQKKVFNFLKNEKPDAVILAAAKVGGILANNTFRADFIYQNLSIQNNVIHGSYLANIKNLIFLGSSCIYPSKCKLPISEDSILTGPLEYTNEPYAVAKIAGVKLCESYNFQYGTNYKCLMPCNIYGEGDNYDLQTSHFFPALIKKIYLSKINKKKYIQLWGDGKPKRELMHSEDLARACLFFLNKKTNKTLINVGSGYEKSIRFYANFIKKKLKSNVIIKFDKTKPNGTMRKIIDSSYANKLGWRSEISLSQGFEIIRDDFLSNFKNEN